ncbi:MAG: restriction endonuclease subunit S [Pyrinomonadaceae bacterium]
MLPIQPEEVPFEIPLNWSWCRLGAICEINGGKRVPAGYSLLTKPTPYIYIRVSDMQNGTIIDTDLHYIDKEIYEQIKRYTISKDDIYMTIVGATIGKCGLVPDRFHNVNLTENAVKITPVLVLRKLLYLLLKMPFAQDQFIEKTKKVGVEKMAIFRFKNSVLPLPPLAEQERIVAKLQKLMKFCDELETNIKQCITNADRLLQTALREALEPKAEQPGVDNDGN